MYNDPTGLLQKYDKDSGFFAGGGIRLTINGTSHPSFYDNGISGGGSGGYTSLSSTYNAAFDSAYINYMSSTYSNYSAASNMSFATQTVLAGSITSSIFMSNGINNSNNANSGPISPSTSTQSNNNTQKQMVNIDTSTANAFISADVNPIKTQLEVFVADKQMVMTTTALAELTNIVSKAAGPIEQANAVAFLSRIQVIPDSPSPRSLQLTVTKSVGANDKIIFGTADQLGIITISSDAKFVRGASHQGVNFNVYIHTPMSLTGR